MPNGEFKQLNIAILDSRGFYGLGLRQVIQKLDGFQDSDIILFRSGEEFFSSPYSVFRMVIFDSDFTDLTSLQMIERINKENPLTSVVILSDLLNEQDINLALKMNVNGFLRKDCSPEELLFALNQIMQGKRYYDSDHLLFIAKSNGKKKHNSKPEHLVLEDVDMQMIRLIADEYTQVEMNKIMELPTSTIMYLRRRLFNKMKVKNTAGLMRRAISYGLIDA